MYAEICAKGEKGKFVNHSRLWKEDDTVNLEERQETGCNFILPIVTIEAQDPLQRSE